MMKRPLGFDEAALWARIARTVRTSGQPRTGQPVIPLALTHDPSPVRPARAPGQTLDASWDRNLAAGRIRPERTIDLHGLSLAAAHARLDRALGEAVHGDARVLLVVTGRAPAQGTSRLDSPLRGMIRASIADWLAASPWSGSIAAVRPAHLRHGGAGALYVVLRRTR